MTRKIKFLSVVLCLFIVSTGFIWSAGQGESESEAKQVVKLLLFDKPLEDTVDPTTGEKIKGANHLIKMFEEENPNIVVETMVLGMDGREAKTEALFLANEVDVMYGAWSDKLYPAGHIMALDELAERDKIMDIYPDYVVGSERVVTQEKLVGLPIATANRTLAYDKQIFEDFGVEPPSMNPIAAEIKELIPQVTGINPRTGEMNYGIYIDGRWMITYILDIFEEGFEYIEDKYNFFRTYKGDWSKVVFNFDTDENAQKIKDVLPLLNYAPISMLSGSGMERWGREDNDIAIIPFCTDSWMIEAKRNDLMDRFIVTNGIKYEGTIPYLNIEVVSVAEKTKNLEASWELAKFLAGPTAQAFFYETLNRMPILNDTSFIPDSDAYGKAYADSIGLGRNPGFPAFFIATFRPWLNNIMAMYLDGKEIDQLVDEGLEKLQKQAEQWAEEY